MIRYLTGDYYEAKFIYEQILLFDSKGHYDLDSELYRYAKKIADDYHIGTGLSQVKLTLLEDIVEIFYKHISDK